MKISTLAAGVALSALMVTGAVASDLNGGSLKDAPSFEAPAIVNWSGVYLGVQGGYGNANHEVNVTGSDRYSGKTFNLIDLDGLNSSGFVGGVNGGADIARGRFLVGVLGGYTFDNMKTDLSLFNGGAKFSLDKNNEWYVGGRAGYVVAPRTLAYIGAAYVQTEYELSGTGIKKNVSETYDGVKALAGIEYAVGGGLFAKIEYQHDFYGDVTWHESKTGSIAKVTDSLDEDKVLFGISYKIGADRVGF